MAARLERSKLLSVLKIILKPLIRELSTIDDAGIDIRRIAKMASSNVKKKCGPEVYNENCSSVQRVLNAKRALRKKTSLLQVSNRYIIYFICLFFQLLFKTVKAKNVCKYTIFRLY